MSGIEKEEFIRTIDHRPWGSFTILADDEDHKIKKIVVSPGQRLSLQRHKHREEHWFVIKGRGLITLDDRQIELGPGESIDIYQGAIHRVQNKGEVEMVFIEIQLGDYFGEDDIERFEDDYGRPVDGDG